MMTTVSTTPSPPQVLLACEVSMLLRFLFSPAIFVTPRQTLAVEFDALSNVGNHASLHSCQHRHIDSPFYRTSSPAGLCWCSILSASGRFHGRSNANCCYLLHCVTCPPNVLPVALCYLSTHCVTCYTVMLGGVAMASHPTTRVVCVLKSPQLSPAAVQSQSVAASISLSPSAGAGNAASVFDWLAWFGIGGVEVVSVGRRQLVD